MTSKPETHERRRYPRLKDCCHIRYKRVEAGTGGRAPLEALTVNISGGGIGFAADEEIAVGTLLAVELGLPGYETPVIALGRVTWCEPSTGGRHEVGLEFWWIGWGDDGAQKAISAHIRKALERS